MVTKEFELLNDKYSDLLRSAVGDEIPSQLHTPAAFDRYVRTGDYIWVSGQVPRFNGEVRYTGRVGETVPIDTAQAAARLCAANLLLVLGEACGGDLDNVKRAVRITGYVRCTDTFSEQPSVIDGASRVLHQVLGDRGRHARTAIGVFSLPGQAAVEIEGVFLI